MRFDLADLRLFLHVADAGSLTHGAERAGLALPSASERVKAMEAVLGVALLRRDLRGTQPTAAGLALLEHARLMLAQFERMKGELGAHARGLKGSIRVLSNTSAISEHLPGNLAGFLARHPTVDIELEERESPDIVEAIAGGQADIGIVADPPRRPVWRRTRSARTGWYWWSPPVMPWRRRGRSGSPTRWITIWWA